MIRAPALDHLFHYAASQRGDELALIDPPNRADFTNGAPRILTYAEADRVVSAIAARLASLGLQRDHVVGMQLPNTVEGILAFLGALRAGLIVSPLPLLWRRADCAAAMTAIGGRALVAMSRVGATDHGALAMEVAAEVFTIRHVCMFGGGLDGVVPLDDVFDAKALQPAAERSLSTARNGAVGAHAAAATWDFDAAGLVAVPRSHVQLMTAGFELTLEGQFPDKSTILSSICLSSLAGIAATLMPWLLSRGTLVLHHPFAPDIMRRQIIDHRCGVVVLPGAVAARCAEAGMFRDSAVERVVAVWRAPERLAACPPWPIPSPALMDVTVFGESGLVAAMRGPDGKPVGLRPGGAVRTRNGNVAPVLVEIARSAAGTIALRGPMVSVRQLSLGTQRTGEVADADGFTDTGYPCRTAPGSDAIVVTGPPASIVGVGGYRFVLSGLQEAVSRIESGAILAAFPDSLTGQRIAGIASRRDAVEEGLAGLGLSALVVKAFRRRNAADARSAA
jgi:hypothetical protein